MFSQQTFGPIPNKTNKKPSNPVTPQSPAQDLAILPNDHFDLDHPGRALHSSIYNLGRSPKDSSLDSALTYPHAPALYNIPRSQGSLGHDRKGSTELPNNNMASPGKGGRVRPSQSPSRPYGLTALSPLQTFSPLNNAQSLPYKSPTRSNSDAGSRSGSTGQHSRDSSITRSLSRRQSLIANAERWSRGEDVYGSRGDAQSLFSCLTIVKAPTEGASLRRAKSSSSLAPFSAAAVDIKAPATSPRGPRRSFAASSFASFTPLSEGLPPKPLPSPFASEAESHATHLFSRYDENTLATQQKPLSPEEVVELAQSLASPVAMPAGGFKGAELKRRKSVGSVGRRGSTLSPEKPPLALEPVEYVQLDEGILLPFVDRPAEVTELVGHPSNDRLFKLLKAAFPKEPLRQHWKALSPEEWHWDEFVAHLTTLSRDESPDYAWIFRARQAVRARSIALWEKLGICLGCDGDLLNAGGDDGHPSSWGGLGLSEEGEYSPLESHVLVEGLEAIDPEELQRAERELREVFGDIVEDEEEQAAAGMTALLGTIGEGEEGMPSSRQPTRAHRGATVTDPIDDPIREGSESRSRSKSFVGLQIMCSPTMGFGDFAHSLSLTPSSGHVPLPVYDRGPGSPLFPSSFSTLSVEPNLGRSASVGIGGGIRAAPADFGHGSRKWSRIERKQSGAGLSESAITFASESEYGDQGEAH